MPGCLVCFIYPYELDDVLDLVELSPRILSLFSTMSMWLA